jgi:hypothetical protein
MKSPKVIFLLLGLVAAVVLLTAATQIQQPQLRQPYSIIMRETNSYPDGHSVLVYTETKWTAATGDWYSIKVFPTGQIEKQFGRPGSGVYMYNPRRQRLDYIRPYPPTSPNPRINLKSPEYVSTGAILGYTAYLLHSQANGMSVDTWVAQDLNGDIIKQVITKNGVIMQLEPVTVELLGPGDPVPPPSWSIP